MDFLDLLRWTTEIRHEFHKIPEIRWEEVATGRLIAKYLNRWGVDWRSCAKTGIVAHFPGSGAKGGSSGAIGLRADMDGLPIQEEGESAWKSMSDGRMHGCGHDGHMAVLLGVARYLVAFPEKLGQPVRLIFQPAEEGGYGARAMIEDGCLDGVERIYGWHNWPSFPLGKIACPGGPLMAANGNLTIVITGRGGHASEPESCRDPLVGAAAVILGLQQITSRNLPPQDAAVVSLTVAETDGAETVIGNRVVLKGSLRVERSDGLEWLEKQIKAITLPIAAGYGLRASVLVEPRYPAVVNHQEEAARVQRMLESLFGDRWQDQSLKTPVMASEDFSYYLEKVPGAFLLVGAGLKSGQTAPLHSSTYDFNDRLIDPMLRIMLGLVGVNVA